jgi:hypothetical protein
MKDFYAQNDLSDSIFENILGAVDGSKHSDVVFGAEMDMAGDEMTIFPGLITQTRC